MDKINELFQSISIADEPALRIVLAFGVFLFSLLILTRARSFGRVLAQRAAARGGVRGSIAQIAAAVVDSTHGLFLFVAAAAAGMFAAPLPEGAGTWVRRVAVLALLIQIGLWASKAALLLVERHFERGTGDVAGRSALVLVGFVIRLVVWCVIALLVLDNLGVNVTALVAGLGIGGIAVALAAQNILGDLFASLSIILDKPFEVGDTIAVGTDIGTVEQIGVKTTRIRMLSGEQLIVSNSDLLTSRIRNMKRMRERRVLFRFGVTHATPVELLERIPAIVREAIERHRDTRFDRAHFAEHGETSLVFEVVYFVLKPDFAVNMDIRQAINLELSRRFAELKIEFALPARTVRMITEPAPQESSAT